MTTILEERQYHDGISVLHTDGQWHLVKRRPWGKRFQELETYCGRPGCDPHDVKGVRPWQVPAWICPKCADNVRKDMSKGEPG